MCNRCRPSLRGSQDDWGRASSADNCKHGPGAQDCRTASLEVQTGLLRSERALPPGGRAQEPEHHHRQDRHSPLRAEEPRGTLTRLLMQVLASACLL